MFTQRRLGIAATILYVTFFLSLPVSAKSVRDFDAMAPADQSDYLITLLDKMIGDISEKNPELGRSIKNFYFHKDENKEFSEGLEKVFAELIALDKSAREGKADLTKIQVESIIVWVTKQKFPPPWNDETRTSKSPTHTYNQ